MKKNHYILSPSILSADFRYLEDQIHQTEAAGADWIHIDVMDGHFVPNITMGPFIVETCKRITSLPLDVHLMIENPENFISQFINAGANIISIHIENRIDPITIINRIKSLGAKAGIVVNPDTSIDDIRTIAKEIDLLLLMSVNPGYAGQKFIEQSIEKIKRAVIIRNLLKANFLIEVDGGITRQNISTVLDAGAEVIVAASAIYNEHGSIKSNILALRK